MNYRLTFLGTGTSQGVPMIVCVCPVCRSEDHKDRRLRCSAMIEVWSGENMPERDVAPTSEADSGGAVFGANGDVAPDLRIVIDAGPDFRTQMLRENVRDVDAILITHAHKDHVGGLDDVRGFNYFHRKAMPVYATEQTMHTIRKDYDYCLCENSYPGAPEMELRTIEPGRAFALAGHEIMPVEGFHRDLPVTGFRIGPLAYLTDFNRIDDAELEKLNGVDMLVINALRWDKHTSHFNVDEALEVGRRVGASRTFFTHMSHQIGLWSDIKDSLPEGFAFAYDGQRVII